jgi:uncharacterized protein (TIGR02246 family)
MRAGVVTRAGLALLLFGSVGCGGCAAKPGGADQEAVDDEVAAIGEVRDDYIAALNAGDLEQAISCWTEDGVLTAALHQPLRGRDAIRTFHEPLLAQFQVEIDLGPEETEVAGEWAFDRGSYTLTVLRKGTAAGSVVGGQRGSYIALFRHQPDGAWALARALVTPEGPRSPS